MSLLKEECCYQRNKSGQVQESIKEKVHKLEGNLSLIMFLNKLYTLSVKCLLESTEQNIKRMSFVLVFFFRCSGSHLSSQNQVIKGWKYYYKFEDSLDYIVSSRQPRLQNMTCSIKQRCVSWKRGFSSISTKMVASAVSPHEALIRFEFI